MQLLLGDSEHRENEKRARMEGSALDWISANERVRITIRY
jgi:hypothetical protein